MTPEGGPQARNTGAPLAADMTITGERGSSTGDTGLSLAETENNGLSLAEADDTSLSLARLRILTSD